MKALRERLSSLLKNRIDRLVPHLRQRKEFVIGEIRRHAPHLRERMQELLRNRAKARAEPTTGFEIRPETTPFGERLKALLARMRHALSWVELQRRWHGMVVWAIEHDTVPAESVARLREKKRVHEERHEARETVRHENDESRTKEEDEQIAVRNMYLQ